MYQLIRGHGSHLGFTTSPINTNFEFRLILLSGFKGEVKNVNQSEFMAAILFFRSETQTL